MESQRDDTGLTRKLRDRYDRFVILVSKEVLTGEVVQYLIVELNSEPVILTALRVEEVKCERFRVGWNCDIELHRTVPSGDVLSTCSKHSHDLQLRALVRCRTGTVERVQELQNGFSRAIHNIECIHDSAADSDTEACNGRGYRSP